MEQPSTTTSSDAADAPASASASATATQKDDDGGQSSVPDVQGVDPEEAARIRSLFPLPLPQEVLLKIEHLAYMNCIREHKRALHREMMETDIFLTIVDTRTWNGQDYLGAHRIPPLISGAASDSDEWDSDEWDSDDEEGMIGWGGVLAGAGGGAGGGGPGTGGNYNANDAMQGLMRLLESRLGPVPHPNQQQEQAAGGADDGRN